MNFIEAYRMLEELMPSENTIEVDLDNTNEALRVVSDPDALYHATEAVPLYKIFKENRLRGNVNDGAGINAVCLTTDKKYNIYGYPCKIQLSRERLVKDGYELIPYDEFEDDPESRGESEERILGDIDNVAKYVTRIYLNWDKIPIAQSNRGDYMSGPKYDKFGEGEEWSLKFRSFIILLTKLKAQGIKLINKGYPMTGKYYLDDNGKCHDGELTKIS